jgi:putative SOS response-associated peptidase YedK
MCGRCEVHTPVEEIARAFAARLTPGAAALPPRYNVSPSLAVPVVRESSHGRVLEAMAWGLVPGWAKDASGSRAREVPSAPGTWLA